MTDEERWWTSWCAQVPTRDGRYFNMSPAELESVYADSVEEATELDNDELFDWAADKLVTPLPVWLIYHNLGMSTDSETRSDIFNDFARNLLKPDFPVSAFTRQPFCCELTDGAVVVERGPKRPGTENPGACVNCGSDKHLQQITPGHWFCSWKCADRFWLGKFSQPRRPRMHSRLKAPELDLMKKAVEKLRDPLFKNLNLKFQFSESKPEIYIGMLCDNWERDEPYVLVAFHDGTGWSVIPDIVHRTATDRMRKKFMANVNSGPAEFADEPVKIISEALNGE